MKTPALPVPRAYPRIKVSVNSLSSFSSFIGEALPPPLEFSETTPHPPSRTEHNNNTGGMISHLRRTDIFRDYQQAFENLTGLPLSLRQAGSFQTPLQSSKRLNPFCGLMAQRNKSCSACLRCQQQVEDEAVREPKTLQCFAGLSESAIPVRIGEKTVGYLQTGQIFLRAPTNQGFEKLLREIGEPESNSEMQELKETYFKSRVIEIKQYQSIIRLLAVFAEYLSTVGNHVMITAESTEIPAITKARAFIAAHHSEDMTLDDAAGAANMSSFYFCKVFKQATGLTFTKYLARLRIEVVKQSLQTVHTRVSEAAFAAGFQSLSQFNRVFQQVAGESPSRFRERLHSRSFRLAAAPMPRAKRLSRSRLPSPALRASGDVACPDC